MIVILKNQHLLTQKCNQLTLCNLYKLKSVYIRMCVCMSQHHGDTAEWILMKLCRHEPRVIDKVYHHNEPEHGTPGGEKWNSNFH